MTDMLDIAARAAALLRKRGAAAGPSISAATVTSVGTDGTATVDLGQGEATVVRIGSGVSAGDVVRVLLDGNGGASVLSNETDPPSNGRARLVERELGEARADIAGIAEIAAEAAAAAAVTDAHVWADGGGTHVADVSQDEWGEAAEAGFPDLTDDNPYLNILVNYLGVLLRSGLYDLVSVTRGAVAFYDGDGDGPGNVVASFGRDGVTFDEKRPWHLGSEDAYIVYIPASGDEPGKMVLGGANVQFGSGKTLSEWEAEVQRIGELADLNADAIAGKQDAGDYATAGDLAGAVASIGGDVAAKADAAETAGALEGLQGYAEELAQGAQAGAEATASALASDAAKKATGYITDISDGGILVHRDDDYDPEGGEAPAHGVRITDTVEIVRGGESMVEVGEQLRVGRADQTHMEGRANRLAFAKDGGDLAWFGQEDEDDPGSPWGLHTEMLYVEDMQRFGGFAWIKRANGNMTLKWIGGGE